MGFFFLMKGDLVVSRASGSDDSTYDEDGLEVAAVSNEDFIKYDDVINSNGLLCLRFLIPTMSFELVNTPDMPATIDKTEIAANDTEIATISDLINPSYISIDTIGGAYEVVDGIFEFSIDTPGAYHIRCWTPDYREKEFTVNAS